MKKSAWLLVGLALCLFASEVKAQSISCAGLPAGAQLVPYAFESLTVSTSALFLTRSVYAPTGSNPANPVILALFSTETDQLRYRSDGTAPTSAVGHVVASGGSGFICNAFTVGQIRFIRSGTSDVPLSVTYFRIQQF